MGARAHVHSYTRDGGPWWAPDGCPRLLPSLGLSERRKHGKGPFSLFSQARAGTRRRTPTRFHRNAPSLGGGGATVGMTVQTDRATVAFRSKRMRVAVLAPGGPGAPAPPGNQCCAPRAKVAPLTPRCVSHTESARLTGTSQPAWDRGAARIVQSCVERPLGFRWDPSAGPMNAPFGRIPNGPSADPWTDAWAVPGG